jgi:hypothetical protein
LTPRGSDVGQTAAAEWPVAFYCVADARYFLGAVAMVNSLRLHGHADQVFLLDCGLTGDQRDLLAREVTVIPAPSDRPPWLLKAVVPLAHPARVMVLVDTDMIVTRPLGDLIGRASLGRVVLFKDRQERFFPEWGEMLGLGETRRGPYISSGLVFLGGAVGEEVIRLMDERKDRVDWELTFWRGNVREYPFLYGDQDVLNGVLATSVEPNRLVALDHRLAATPPFRRLRVLDEAGLRCAYGDGTQPYVLHQFVRKPWLEPMYHSIYSRFLARLLLGADVAVRVPEAEVPRRMRDGFVARVERAAVNAKDLARFYLGDLLPERMGVHVEALRRRWEARRS